MNREAVIISLAVVLAAVVALSYIQISTLESRYWKLYGDYQQLNLSHVKLVADYNRLNDDYSKLASDYSRLVSEYDRLQSDYSKLNNDYSRLKSDYTALSQQYNRLEGDYRRLTSDYASLKDSYSRLKSEYDMLSKKYDTVKMTYEGWLNYYNSFLYVTNSFQRVFSEEEIQKLVPLVRSIITDPNDAWKSYFELYQYVRNNIVYTYDVYVPIPPTFKDLENGVFTRTLWPQTVQAPSETLERKAGDVEDQAILLYAMIKAWHKYLREKETILWLMVIEMNNGYLHAAVAFPVQGGRLAILDPAGNYYTGRPGTFRSEDPFVELRRYSNWWSDFGGIKRIAVYDPTTGEKVVEGDINTVAQFISTH